MVETGAVLPAFAGDLVIRCSALKVFCESLVDSKDLFNVF